MSEENVEEKKVSSKKAKAKTVENVSLTANAVDSQPLFLPRMIKVANELVASAWR